MRTAYLLMRVCPSHRFFLHEANNISFFKCATCHLTSRAAPPWKMCCRGNRHPCVAREQNDSDQNLTKMHVTLSLACRSCTASNTSSFNIAASLVASRSFCSLETASFVRAESLTASPRSDRSSLLRASIRGRRSCTNSIASFPEKAFHSPSHAKSTKRCSGPTANDVMSGRAMRP